MEIEDNNVTEEKLGRYLKQACTLLGGKLYGDTECVVKTDAGKLRISRPIYKGKDFRVIAHTNNKDSHSEIDTLLDVNQFRAVGSPGFATVSFSENDNKFCEFYKIGDAVITGGCEFYVGPSRSEKHIIGSITLDLRRR